MTLSARAIATTTAAASQAAGSPSSSRGSRGPRRHMPQVIHVVDDTLSAGAARMLDFLSRDEMQLASGRHFVVPVWRVGSRSARVRAEVIVSHLPISRASLQLLQALRARHPDAALVQVEHGCCAARMATGLLRRLRLKALMRATYGLCDRVVALNAAQGAWLVSRGFVPASRLQVIPPCSRLTDFLALAPIGGAPRHLGAIGPLVGRKGFDLLIEAFRQLPDPNLTLTLVGDGPDRPLLELLARSDKRIRFTGASARPEVMMRRLDAVIMPSRAEVHGLVGLEARAAGRALLVTPIDGLRDHVVAGAAVCDGADVTALQAALAQLVQDDSGTALGADRARARADAEAAPARFRAAWAALVGQLVATDPELRHAA